MDSRLIMFAEPLFRALHKKGSTAPAWHFTYHEFVRCWQVVRARPRLPTAVPYQMRHSGPSIDLALGHR
eukprot:8111246-Lingulodinium_polyedra.AAC.1